MELLEIMYTSTASRLLTQDELLELLQQCHQYNPTHEITGILLYKENHFLGLLEGQADKVDALFTRIRHDRRHQDIHVLSRRFIDTRSFERWRMSFLCWSNLCELLPEYFSIMDRETFASFNNVENEAVRRMLNAFRFHRISDVAL